MNIKVLAVQSGVAAITGTFPAQQSRASLNQLSSDQRRERDFPEFNTFDH